MSFEEGYIYAKIPHKNESVTKVFFIFKLQLTQGDLFLCAIMEQFLKPNAGSYSSFLSFDEDWKKKQSLIWDTNPCIKSYYQRIREHPMLAKYFKERPSDREVDF
jgi:hypothetical protein